MTFHTVYDIIITVVKRRCGGIGRRAGLKIRWSKIRIGSTPIIGTNQNARSSSGRFFHIKEKSMRIQKIGLSNIWLAFSTLVILVLSVLGHDSVIGTISAVTGVCYTILTGKGKASAYIFGIINVLGYSYVSFKAGFYGEVMLNVLYFLPMCIIGWVLWRKNTDNLTGEVT